MLKEKWQTWKYICNIDSRQRLFNPLRKITKRAKNKNRWVTKEGIQGASRYVDRYSAMLVIEERPAKERKYPEFSNVWEMATPRYGLVLSLNVYRPFRDNFSIYQIIIAYPPVQQFHLWQFIPRKNLDTCAKIDIWRCLL